MSDLLLLDLSSLVHPLFHLSGTEPDPDWTSTQAVAKARALGSKAHRMAVCCDRGRSFRKDISADYKGNRPEKNETLIHQLRLTEEKLRQDGYPIFGEPGFEADDIVASLTMQAVERGVKVTIASSDKDLLQLVTDLYGVTAMSLRDGTVFDESAVLAKFGVTPSQMTDYLALVGDSSDNIKGVVGIGPKKAVKLLSENGLTNMTAEQKDAFDKARALVLLRTDAPVKLDDALAEPVPQETREDVMSEVLTPEVVEAVPEVVAPTENAPMKPTAMAVAGSWDTALEPRNAEDARTVAKWLHESRLFSQYGSPQAVFSVVMAGRELGLGAMASLRAFHVVEGRPTMAAEFIRALVLNSGKAEYFRCVERTPESSTWETKRKGDPEATRLTYTLDEAKTAGLVRDKSGWVKHPSDLIAKTASTKLARLVYPDVTFGLYATEEVE